MALSACKCGGMPVEQVRDKMGPGDYFGHPEDYHTKVEMFDAIRNDVRISCPKCGKHTGWNKADAPGMPGAGLDFLHKKWNEANSV
jgi:hypothetical protein